MFTCQEKNVDFVTLQQKYFYILFYNLDALN